MSLEVICPELCSSLLPCQGGPAAVQAAELFPLLGRQQGTNDEQIMQCCLHLQQRFNGQVSCSFCCQLLRAKQHAGP